MQHLKNGDTLKKPWDDRNIFFQILASLYFRGYKSLNIKHLLRWFSTFCVDEAQAEKLSSLLYFSGDALLFSQKPTEFIILQPLWTVFLLSFHPGSATFGNWRITILMSKFLLQENVTKNEMFRFEVDRERAPRRTKSLPKENVCIKNLFFFIGTGL